MNFKNLERNHNNLWKLLVSDLCITSNHYNYHSKTPTWALLNSLPFIVYPVLDVKATVLDFLPYCKGICATAYCLFGSKIYPKGSNSFIP